MKIIGRISVVFSIVYFLMLSTTLRAQNKQLLQNRISISNPYKAVSWEKVGYCKANLHCHTTQSDGYYSVKEVIEAYHNAGYLILSITDHDSSWPNEHVLAGRLPLEKATPFPMGPRPKNFPANTTWPWSSYGSPTPESIGMVGVEGNEVCFRHDFNSYFSNYGVWYEKTGDRAPWGGILDETGKEIWEDDQLLAVRDSGGIAVINHPGVPSRYKWWQRKSLDWYVERFRKHTADYLVGIEVTNNKHADWKTEKYDEGLWDQLLSRFMPERPIWGFAGDDMHDLLSSQETYIVFLLDELTKGSVRDAMKLGQFYFCKSSRRINLKDYKENSHFPIIKKIEVNENSGTIEIIASDYDRILWISSPASQEPIADYVTSDEPYPLGTVVYEGNKLSIKDTPGIKKYVRAELIKEHEGQTFRTFINPIGITRADSD